MARPTGWDILGLEGDPTPGVVESVQALAKEFGDFAHDVQAAYQSLNSFGSDTAALQWVGQTAEAFKSHYGPMPGRLQKLYTSYSEASDALSAYAPQLQAAQSKADSALRQAQDAHADLQRATTNANSAAADLKTAQQNHTANPNPQAVTDAQNAHNTAQTNLDNAKARMAALTQQANDAYNDRINAAKACAKAIGHAQDDGIHNKSWWEHLGEELSDIGGEIAKIAGELAPILDIIALATSWIPGVDVVTAALAEADNIIALVGTAMATVGDALQGHWGDALLGAGMLALAAVGAGGLGSEVEGEAGALEGEAGALEGEAGALDGAEGGLEGGENAVGDEAGTAEGGSNSTCETDPVDVVSGRMITDDTDLKLPGVLPIILRRAYASGYRTGRLFGPGWSSTLDQRVSINAAGIHYAGDDAQRLDYATPADSEQVLPARGSSWPLVWDRATDEIRITDPRTGQTRHFAAIHYQDENGQIRDLTAITDRNGNRITIVRDAQGTPQAVEHPAYRVLIDTASGPAGLRISGLRLADGTDDGIAVKQFHYDERGRLTGVVDSSGVPFNYEWDESDRITAWIDRVGFRFEYEYDSLGRVVRAAGDGGFMSGTFEYDPANRRTTFVNSLGASTVYTYDRAGHITSTTDALEHTAVSEYDDRGRLIKRIDPLGSMARYDYDEAGDLVRFVGFDGAVAEVGYDDQHRAVSFNLPDGSRRYRAYDESGNVLTATDPVDGNTHYTHRSDGAVLSITDPMGAVTQIECDLAGLPIAVTDPLGMRTEMQRDAFGRIVAVTDPLGARTAYGWTVEGRALWRYEPDGGRITWEYDAEGQLIRAVNPLGATVTYEPGPFGRLAARTDPDGVRYEFTRDTELRLVSVERSDAVWNYEWDAAGRLVGETDFIGRTLAYEYDAVGRLVARTDALGQRVTMERDAAGRLVRRQTPEGEYVYRYDVIGRLAAAVGPDSTVEYTRDAAGRVLTESVDGRVVRSDYDGAGRRVLRTTPGGAVSEWAYDLAGNPSALTTEAGRLAFTVNAVGHEVERVLDGHVFLSQQHDVAGRLTAQRLWTGDVFGSATEVLHREWFRRADGMPIQIDDSTRGRTRYEVDASGRVVAAVGAQWSETYSYDEFGNLAAAATSAATSGAEFAAGATSSADFAAGATSGADFVAGAIAGAADAVAAETGGRRQTSRTLTRQAGRTRYHHDEAGRLIRSVRTTLDGRRKTWEYSWDSADRLRQVTTPDGSVWRYGYDPLGRRISKERVLADGSVADRTLFAWDGLRLAEQLSVSPDGTETTVTWDYDPGTHRPAAQTTRTRRIPAVDQAELAPHAELTDQAEIVDQIVDQSADQAEIDAAFYAIVTDLVGTPTELVAPDGQIAWQVTKSLWGQTVHVTTGEGGVDCPLRFPGQYHDDETGLSYNLHRYYDPVTGAYLTPDPLGLAAAPNDHSYVPNPLVWADPLGLKCYSEDELCDVTELKGDEPGTAQRLMDAPEYNGGELRGFRDTNNPDFIDSRGKTYDAVGGPSAWTHPKYNENAMLGSIKKHIYGKSGFDYTVLDMTGANSSQVDAVFSKLDEWGADPGMKELNKLIILGDTY